MKTRRLPLFCFILFCLLALAGRVQAALLAWETPLTGSVTPAELNLDSNGVLWVSDADAGEIRAVDTASGAYKIYPVGGSPSDAHGDGAGTVWWADFDNNQVGRLTTSNNITTTWEIPGSTDFPGLWGIALGQNGQVWASHGTDPSLYKLGPPNPSTNLLPQCTYTLPDSGAGEYLTADQGRVWLGDSDNGRIVRLDGAIFTWWNLPNLPNVSHPRDLVLDGSGRVWWTDPSKGIVGRLDPVANSITIYTPPISGTPQMLTLLDGKVWYTQQGPPGLVVKLDPAAVSGITMPVTTGSLSDSPTCSTLQPQTSVHITPISGQVSSNVTTYATLIDHGGWSLYAMPAGAKPYGIAAKQQIWLVDQDRHMLVKVSPSSPLYLPVIIKSH